MQEYEKQMKSFGIGMGSTPSSGGLRQGSQTGSTLAASLANSKKRVVGSQSMLESRYSKTFIYTPQAKEVKVKEVRCQQLSIRLYNIVFDIWYLFADKNMWYFSWEGGVLNRLLNLLNPRRLSWLSFQRRLATWRWSLQTSPGEFNNPSITTYLVKSNYHHIFGGIQLSPHIWWNPIIITYFLWNPSLWCHVGGW